MSFLPRVVALNRKSFVRTRTRKWGADGRLAVQGVNKRSGARAGNRVALLMIGFVVLYGAVGARMAQYGMERNDDTASVAPPNRLLASRPDILDRNGRVLATDIRTVSLYAEPRKIVDVDDAVEKLSSVLPSLDRKTLYHKLKANSAFQWIKRQLTPKQQSRILALGVPGIGFRPETRRFYPAGATTSHIVGFVNIDNNGIAGMEKYIDRQGLSALAGAGLTVDQKMQPVRLSIDLRVQHIVRDELLAGMKKFNAIGAGAVVLKVDTGEVIALASVPDFNPNNPVHAQDKNRLNRMTAGTYEMGSVFKTFTTAMALDTGVANLKSSYDASHPLRIGGFLIHDFHNMHRALTVPEVFIHSSNIGSAREALDVGIPRQKAFLKRLGLLTRMNTELPEVATPFTPKVWKPVNSATVAFGHGLNTTPLQTAVAAAALMNGGKFMEPTFLPRTEKQAMAVSKQVVKPQTAKDMRYLFRLNVMHGSGGNADVQGYRVGGKTGTADKVVNGRYSKSKNFNSFLAAFPVDDPKYVVLVSIDEPHRAEGEWGFTAGFNAAPMVGAIIRRSASALGVDPKFAVNDAATLVSQSTLSD
ncbi:peptidoglycan D,D-transpeptidase FtsI family protein [Pararhizobium mangrovi]|uniref:Penicillin-binding protein 2 n=1 Tax=Pararhizobium mangrovi TaxID=2590452 RepID=A0A506U4K0_9HYPH|nr:penicillin-binding protein 2 [Pararhizobium mangrovi]TPW29282.1 penicillin-binding protein 2 [Pararhizobium mangrovi]